MSIQSEPKHGKANRDMIKKISDYFRISENNYSLGIIFIEMMTRTRPSVYNISYCCLAICHRCYF